LVAVPSGIAGLISAPRLAGRAIKNTLKPGIA
jgi:hypothetical protein